MDWRASGGKGPEDPVDNTAERFCDELAPKIAYVDLTSVILVEILKNRAGTKR